MDERKTIKVIKDKHLWSAVKTGATHAFMGLDRNDKLVRARDAGVYMIMN